MDEVVLKVERRTIRGKQVNVLRRSGKLPAVLYGRGIDPLPVMLDFREASRALGHLGSSALVSLELDGKRHMALIREKQRNYIKGSLQHVDFQIVSATERLRVAVAIELRGEAPVVKELNGIVQTGREEIEVECLSQDLPERIVVDISGLKNIGDSIHVRDLVLPPNVEVMEALDDMIVMITPQAAEEVVEEVVEPGPTEPEVIERGKKEEEEGEEL
jgi:large subunit ribosomal protein L25